MSTDQAAEIEIEEVTADDENTGDDNVEAQTNDASDDDEVTVSIGEPPPHDEDDEEQPEDTPAIKKLRERHRELAKEAREARAERDALKAQLQPAAAKPSLRPKPDPADYGFVDEVYEPELLKWYDEKRKVDEAAALEAKRVEDETKALNAKHAAYKAAGAKLKTPPSALTFDEAEDVVRKHLSLAQQSILLDAADDPAVLVYALGSNPEEAKRLGALKNLGTFAVNLGRLESKVKVSRKPTTSPEKPVGGSRAPGSSTDNKRDRLEKAAAESGDMTALFAYDREQAKKKR